MPIFNLLTDVDGAEQSAGEFNRSNRKGLFALDPTNPLSLFNLGGHYATDGREYTMQEASPAMERVTVNGYNQTELVHVDSDVIQDERITVSLPDKRLTAAHFLKRTQERENRKFLYMVLPLDECPTECDYFAEVIGKNGRMGEITDTGAVTIYDTEGDGGQIIKQVIIMCQGSTVDYHGIRVDESVLTMADSVYTVAVGSRKACLNAGSFCPWTVGFSFDADGLAAPTSAKTTDKWASVNTSALDVSGLPIASLITGFVEWRGDYYVAYADSHKSTATAGGVARSATSTAAFASVGLTSAGIHALVVAGTRLHAFGTDGEWHYTTDGINWTTVTGAPLGANDLYCAVYNPKTKRIYVGGESGTAYAIRADLVATALTGFSTDQLSSAHVAGDDHIVFGTSAGKIYEHFQASGVGGAFTNTQDFGAGAINFLGGDRQQTNLIASVGGAIHQRSVIRFQDWVKVGDAPGSTPTILSGAQGYQEHRAGTEYFLFGTNNGDVFQVQVCDTCSSPPAA